jgi:hypothetical protein
MVCSRLFFPEKKKYYQGTMDEVSPKCIINVKGEDL